MTDHLKDPFFDYHAHLKVLPDYVLRDIARNDCAERDYRRQAVEVLVVRKSPLANSPELADLKAELDIELEGVQFEYPAFEEAPPKNSGPLVASVTTATMFLETPEAAQVLDEVKKSTEEILGADIVPTTQTGSVPPKPKTSENSDSTPKI